MEATRAVPTLTVVETHPGGGQYDCLTLLDDGVHIDINRIGSIHVHKGRKGPAMSLMDHATWIRAVVQPGGARKVTEQLLDAAGLPFPARRPASTPRVLTYRVIARLLAARVLDRPDWDVRSQFVDTSGYGGGIAEPVPWPEMGMVPANQVWRVLRGPATVAWLWEGWAWTAAGQRRDLMSEYARGATVDHLVGIVTEAPTRRSGHSAAASARPAAAALRRRRSLSIGTMTLWRPSLGADLASHHPSAHLSVAQQDPHA